MAAAHAENVRQLPNEGRERRIVWVTKAIEFNEPPKHPQIEPSTPRATIGEIPKNLSGGSKSVCCQHNPCLPELLQVIHCVARNPTPGEQIVVDFVRKHKGVHCRLFTQCHSNWNSLEVNDSD